MKRCNCVRGNFSVNPAYSSRGGVLARQWRTLGHAAQACGDEECVSAEFVADFGRQGGSGTVADLDARFAADRVAGLRDGRWRAGSPRSGRRVVGLGISIPCEPGCREPRASSAAGRGADRPATAPATDRPCLLARRSANTCGCGLRRMRRAPRPQARGQFAVRPRQSTGSSRRVTASLTTCQWRRLRARMTSNRSVALRPGAPAHDLGSPC